MDSHQPPPPRATAEPPPASGAVAAAAATHAADAADAADTTQAADAVDTVYVLEAAAATRAVEAVQAVALSTGVDRAERQSGGQNGDRDGAMQEVRTQEERMQGEMQGEVIEHLRLKVPAAARQAWLEAEQVSWEPWLQQQPGFLGRQLHWHADSEEGQLLIRWASRALWQAIPAAAVEQVQAQFERSAHAALARLGVPPPQAVRAAAAASPAAGEAVPEPAANPFPLVYAGELEPDAQP